MHLVHAAQVVAFKHPDENIAARWLLFYIKMCDQMHMTPETVNEFDDRLNDFGVGIHNELTAN